MTGVLADGYDLVVFDLDGVIYLIDKPIAGAAEAVERLRAGGKAVAYATNNASRRAADVAALLTGMGVPAAADEVLTSAGAAAAMLAERLPALALTRADLDKGLGDWVGDKEKKALLLRRDLMAAQIKQMVAKRGESVFYD